MHVYDVHTVVDETEIEKYKLSSMMWSINAGNSVIIQTVDIKAKSYAGNQFNLQLSISENF